MGSIAAFLSEPWREYRTNDRGQLPQDGSYVYAIDIASATATRGLEVEGGSITSIKKLEPVE
ncbi:hypothetical protein SAMN05443144_102136 [Fodinibius roseus]|uniref:Uncharacterized protein n=1 Tax=Fodinibius roseus TaxID=1194090 RepID=A0A1M4UVM3_9BACT|nr:hypothetical protein [Fodinibius roseus]SHE60719.1 hypothetical protein SAMN05443144_102136 [Fodinibius roseus]